MKSYAFILFTFFTTLLTAQVTYLQCGALFDAEKKKFLGPHTILIEGNQITAVKKGHQSPSNSEDRLIDLKSKTIYPGFIDMHVHIEGEYSPDRYLKVFQNNPEDVAYDAAAIARRTLMAGFTAVRDMGGTGVNIALRNAINNGKIPGPRIFTAGKAIGTTGGHADPTNGFRKDMVGDPGP
ncbi:MAG: amidohydrolase family protein, partial [Flavobacteriaceae bacterium]